MAFTVVPACDSSDSGSVADGRPNATASSTDGDAGEKDGGTIVCHCPGSCGLADKDVEWPADRSCGEGACDGISNCVERDAADGG
jgi:hypothetical protein